MKIISHQLFVLCAVSLWLFNINAFAQSTSLLDLVGQQDIAAVKMRLTTLSSSQLSEELAAKSGRGDTALLITARDGNLELFDLLVAAGADINALDPNRRDVLNIAITTRNVALAKRALAAGIDATMVTSRYQGSALIYGSAKGQLEIVTMLIAAGAPLDRVNNIGWTALLEAVILGNGGQVYQDIVAALLQAGADKSIADSQGATPLEHAQSKGFTEIAALLSE